MVGLGKELEHTGVYQKCVSEVVMLEVVLNGMEWLSYSTKWNYRMGWNEITHYI